VKLLIINAHTNRLFLSVVLISASFYELTGAYLYAHIHQHISAYQAISPADGSTIVSRVENHL
jgi:hypothetical protein